MMNGKIWVNLKILKLHKACPERVHKVHKVYKVINNGTMKQ